VGAIIFQAILVFSEV